MLKYYAVLLNLENLLANIGVDTAENEPSELLSNSSWYTYLPRGW